MAEQSNVTPWEVTGTIDYDRLITQFGTQPLTDTLKKRIESYAGTSSHFLRRNIFFSHRELQQLLDDYDTGKEFALYTGRGPSGNTHLGHLIPWMFTKYLQDAFQCDLYFQITDDEKFLYKRDLTLDQTTSMAYENALDLIALGFDSKKTHIIIDTEYIKTLYPIALDVAKRVTASTAKSVFGFKDETNIGMYIWPAMQAAPCFLPSILKEKQVRTLIPAAIDQDPYWRIVRDIAPKLGYPKTAAIHCRFLPPLTGSEGKMSTSVSAESTIFTTDDPTTVKKKINKYAYSGGQPTLEEHRTKGGDPDIDASFQWLTFFEPDDEKLAAIAKRYRSGELLSGELKNILIETINSFLAEHQKKREEARSQLSSFLLHER